MNGKEKCAHLRQLREEVARQHNIPYVSTPCTYQGDDCIGTCPKCEEELRYLTEAIHQKERLGQPVNVMAVMNMELEHLPDQEFLIEQEDTVEIEMPEEPTGLMGLVSYEPEEPTVTIGEINPKPTGYPVTVCSSCGFIHLTPSQFCGKCGAPLKSAADRNRVDPGGMPGQSVRDRMDKIRKLVDEVIEEGNQEQILRLNRGLEDIIRWLDRMETRSARERREREIWELQMQRTPGVMISDEDLKKRKKRKGWF